MQRYKSIVSFATLLLVGATSISAAGSVFAQPRNSNNGNNPVTTPAPQPGKSGNTKDILGGTTSVRLSSEFAKMLSAAKVQPTAVSGTTVKGNTATFPISGGAVDMAKSKAEIIHQGGLVLSAGSNKVELTDFVIQNMGNKPMLSGLVTVNGNLLGRAPLFEVGLSATKTPTSAGSKVLDFKNTNLTLTAEAATALNQVFGSTAFKPKVTVGTASVEATDTPAETTPVTEPPVKDPMPKPPVEKPSGEKPDVDTPSDDKPSGDQPTTGGSTDKPAR